MVSFKSIFKYTNLNGVHPRRTDPRHGILNFELPKLKWEILKQPSFSCPCPELRVGPDDLCRVLSSLNFPMRVQSVQYGSVQEATADLHRHWSGLWWQTAAEDFGGDLKVVLANDNAVLANHGIWCRFFQRQKSATDVCDQNCTRSKAKAPGSFSDCCFAPFCFS